MSAVCHGPAYVPLSLNSSQTVKMQKKKVLWSVRRTNRASPSSPEGDLQPSQMRKRTLPAGLRSIHICADTRTKYLY